MYCDYDKLIDEGIDLNKDFTNIMDAITNMEESLEKINNVGNWEAPAKDEFTVNSSTIIDNFDIINNRFNNINQYLNVVIDSYKSVDQTNYF